MRTNSRPRILNDEDAEKMSADLYHPIVANLRSLMARILEPSLNLNDFLSEVARFAKELNPEVLEARVHEVDFNDNTLFLRTSTQVDVDALSQKERTFVIQPGTITGDATIENRFIVSTPHDPYGRGRFAGGKIHRAAFPIEFFDEEMPEGRTKYVLVVDKTNGRPFKKEILDALRDYSVLAGLAISIKELRDKRSRFYEENRNLVLTGRHAAAIGHDIRSLNIGVGGYLKLAQKHIKRGITPEALANILKFLELAEENASQIEALLRNFSYFNKKELELSRDTDLLDAVTKKIDSLANRLDFGRYIRFNLNLPGEKTGFKVDPDWFGTVVENLVKNSMEACGGETHLYVTLKNEPNRIVLSFEDDCGGIPSEILQDIFTPYRTGKKSGQGLGLANAKKVVNEHGGRIFVTSRSGHGAVFTIEFPKSTVHSA